MGGMGMHTAMGGTVSLFGKVYCSLRDPNAGPSGFDAFRVPDRFLFSCAETDFGKDYAEQLILFRDHLFAHHSAVRELQPVPAEELEGPGLDLTGLVRVSARSAPTGGMELATVSSGVPGPSSNTVEYFDLRRHALGEPPTPIPISIGNALFEQLQFPLLFEEGIGGYFSSKATDEVRVCSTTGAFLTMHDYTKAMLFQNQRFRYLGRLGQEWLLAQHSREVEERMKFQKYGLQQKLVVQRKYQRGDAVQQEGGGARVQMAASTPGSKACVLNSLRALSHFIYVFLSLFILFIYLFFLSCIFFISPFFAQTHTQPFPFLHLIPAVTTRHSSRTLLLSPPPAARAPCSSP